MRRLRLVGALALLSLHCTTPNADAPVASAGAASNAAAALPTVEAPKGFRIFGSYDFEHGSTVVAAAVSLDGKRLATGTSDGDLVIWDVAKKAVLFKLPAIAPIAGQSITFSQTGEHIAVLAKGSATLVIEANSGKLLTTIPESVHVAPVFAGAELWLGFRGAIFAVDPRTGRRLKTFAVDTPPVRSVAVSSDGKWVAATSLEEVKVWASAGGAPVLARKPKYPRAVVFTPDDKLLAVVTNDNISVLTVPAGQEEAEILTRSNDTERLVVQGTDLFSLSFDRYQKTASIARHSLNEKKSYGSKAQQTADAVALSTSGPALVAHGRGVALLDPVTLTRSGAPSGHSDRVENLAITEDARWLVSSASDGLALAWDLTAADGAPTLLGDSQDRVANAIAVSRLGHFAAVGTPVNRTKGVRVTELSSGRAVLSPQTIWRPTGLHFSADEATLWIGTEHGQADSWNLAALARERSLQLVVPTDSMSSSYFDILFFSERSVIGRERGSLGAAASFKLPGGRPLAKTFAESLGANCHMGRTLLYCPSASSAKQVSVIDPSTGKLVQRIEVGLAVDALAEADDGKLLIAAERDTGSDVANATSSLATYNVGDGKLVSRVVAPKQLTSLACSGKTIAFGAADGSVGTFGR